MKIIVLGTSSMTPTPERNHPSIFVDINGTGILLDCGEGTQRQIRIAKIRPNRIKYVFITHWHGDHVLGLPGLLQMLAANNYNDTLTIVGPKGTKQSIKYMIKAFEFTSELNFVVKEEKKIVFDKYIVDFFLLKHPIRTLAYRIIEKPIIKIEKEKLKKYNLSGPLVKELKSGKSVKINGKEIDWRDVGFKTKKRVLLTYITDTLYFEELSDFAQQSEILFIESTYSIKDKDKAKIHFHMSIDDAINVAKKANVKKVVLMHFSQRYKDLNLLKRDLELLNQDVFIANDFDHFVVY